MAYTRLHWVESETPLSADNMNNIEDGIEELKSQKVDKVSGKALSDQNYTAAEKTKLAGIEAGAEVNVQADWNQTNTSADGFIQNKPVNATTSTAGFMSASDKSKLDGVQAGAQVNPGNATTSAAGLMSAADKTKLNGIATGAEVNQNAFSNVKVGSTTVSADGKTDTLELVAGSNVTLTPDATNDKVTIAATDTKYNAATTSAAGLMSAADKTKLNGIAAGATKNTAVATTSANGLMSSSDKTKLNGIAEGAQVNPGNATTSAAGLMSAADKTKLNGIEEGATALKCKSYTFTLDANVTVNAGSTATLVFEDFPAWAAIQSIMIRGTGNVALPTIAIIGFYYSANKFNVDVRNLSTTESVLISSAYTRLGAIRFGNNI